MQAISAPWWMTSRLMCRISSDIAWSAHGPSLGPMGRVSVLRIEVAYPSDPVRVCVVELLQRRLGVGGVVPGLVVGRRAAEVEVVAHCEHADDHVGEPPRDGRERLGLRRRVGEVDRAVGMNRPAVRHRLPEVLLIGQAVQPRAQLVRPVDSRVGRPVGWSKSLMGSACQP